MIPVERQKAIMLLLQQQAVVSIQQLTHTLNVSHMTIRRDIAKLEEQGLVLSVAGGVALATTLYDEPSHLFKREHQCQEKCAIGRAAAQLVPVNACIYLDAGTTTLEIARALLDRSDLRIITNDFVITELLLQQSQHQLHHTGGRIDRDNLSCIGEQAAAAIRQFNIDLAFVSSSSWDLRGISTPSEDKVVVKRAIMTVSRRKYLVCDASKFGRVAPFHAVDMSEFDSIVTDNALPARSMDELVARGIAINIA